MRMVKQLTNNKFLNIKEVTDPENNVRGYQFAERRGVDSVAFICYDSSKVYELGYTKFLLNKEYTPPTNEFHVRAFGGSIDKDKPKTEIVKEEVKEECGFEVKEKSIHELGKVFVSTQMNQYCHLFLVEVDDSLKCDREPENETEATSTPIWVTEEELVNGTDWKSIVILHRAKLKGII